MKANKIQKRIAAAVRTCEAAGIDYTAFKALWITSGQHQSAFDELRRALKLHPELHQVVHWIKQLRAEAHPLQVTLNGEKPTPNISTPSPWDPSLGSKHTHLVSGGLPSLGRRR